MNHNDTTLKKAARNLANRARRLGFLVSPGACEKCGSRERLEMDHRDYSQPLIVQWVCRPCHDILSYEARVANVERRRKYAAGTMCLCGRAEIKVSGVCKKCYMTAYEKTRETSTDSLRAWRQKSRA